MEFLIGVLGLLLLGTVYVGLGLADRGREACHDCSLADDPESCDACPLVLTARQLEKELDTDPGLAGEVAGQSVDRGAGRRGRRLPMWKPGEG